MKYRITSEAGMNMGTYEDGSEEDAIRAMNTDAGCPDLDRNDGLTVDEIIDTTIESVCAVYGVPLPVGFDGSEPVRFYGDDDGWHVDSTVCDLPDEGWAPTTDDIAREIAEKL